MLEFRTRIYWLWTWFWTFASRIIRSIYQLYPKTKWELRNQKDGNDVEKNTLLTSSLDVKFGEKAIISWLQSNYHLYAMNKTENFGGIMASCFFCGGFLKLISLFYGLDKIQNLLPQMGMYRWHVSSA